LPVYGASSGWWSSTLGRVLSGVRCGVVSWFVPPGLADEVTAQARGEADAAAAAAGDTPRRQRFRALPARVGVYFVLGLCLYSHLPYGEVLKELSGGLQAALASAGWADPSSAALTAVRRRLGERPFELLFRRLAGPLSPGRDPWSQICGLLAVAWDGTTVKTPASPENIAWSGKPGHRGKNKGGPSAAGEAAYPQARLVALVACGTRALLGAGIGPLKTGERELAAGLTRCLQAGMLLLADRGFYSYRLWKTAAGAGADLLWRIQAGVHLPVVRPLPDGSWLSVVNDPAAARCRRAVNGKRRRRGSALPPQAGPLPGALTVRVIEFWVTVTADDGTVRTERYRMITTLLDWRACPAAALAAGYARRWAIETAYREFKTYLRGPGRILRGRTPDLARQELWAALAICQVIRTVIALAAVRAGTSPDRLSFTTALHAIRRTLPAARTSPDAALAETEAAIAAVPVPLRPGRVCLRAVTRPSSPYPSRRNAKGPLSQHASCTVTIQPLTQASRTTTDQAEHQAQRETQPP
jgi:hypothetical protein